MCGIVGYAGSRPCRDILFQGLRKLEYRGYDSAGISVMGDGEFALLHSVGNLDNLEAVLDGSRRRRPRSASPTPAGPPTGVRRPRTPIRIPTARTASPSC